MGRQGSDTKERLIATATELIWLNSYGSVSVDEICTKAGVKKGSFYHFFPSKADLALGAMDACYEAITPELNDIFSPGRPPLERFTLLAEHIYTKQEATREQYGHVCGCPFATLGSELAALDETIREKIDSICKRHLAYYENALRDMVSHGLIPPETDIEAKAEELYAYVLGQLMMARIQNSTQFLKLHLQDGLFRMLGVDAPTALSQPEIV